VGGQAGKALAAASTGTRRLLQLARSGNLATLTARARKHARRYKNRHIWLGFIDVDEFIVIKGRLSSDLHPLRVLLHPGWRAPHARPPGHALSPA
jgi:hypothetical protein